MDISRRFILIEGRANANLKNAAKWKGNAVVIQEIAKLSKLIESLEVDILQNHKQDELHSMQTRCAAIRKTLAMTSDVVSGIETSYCPAPNGMSRPVVNFTEVITTRPVTSPPDPITVTSASDRLPLADPENGLEIVIAPIPSVKTIHSLIIPSTDQAGSAHNSENKELPLQVPAEKTIKKELSHVQFENVISSYENFGGSSGPEYVQLVSEGGSSTGTEFHVKTEKNVRPTKVEEARAEDSTASTLVLSANNSNNPAGVRSKKFVFFSTAFKSSYTSNSNMGHTKHFRVWQPPLKMPGQSMEGEITPETISSAPTEKARKPIDYTTTSLSVHCDQQQFYPLKCASFCATIIIPVVRCLSHNMDIVNISTQPFCKQSSADDRSLLQRRSIWLSSIIVALGHYQQRKMVVHFAIDWGPGGSVKLFDQLVYHEEFDANEKLEYFDIN